MASKVLIIVGDGGESYETWYAVHRFQEAGVEPVVAAPAKRRLHLVIHDFEPGWDTYKERPGYVMESDITFDDVNVKDYDAVLCIGGRAPENDGYDLMGIITGSEGLLGVVTEITVRILKKPETARALMVGFSEVEAAGECVARVIGAGIIPGGMEMMDKDAIHAAEAFVHAGYPLDVEALLIIELDGPSVEVDELIRRVEAIALDCRSTTCQISNSEQERLLFWAGRKAAFPAVGRLSPDYLCMDGTIPRGKLPEALAGIRELGKKYGLRCANVFHAGDGNLHPLILYDANIADEMQRAEDFGADILRLCVKLGGVLSGEHGIGVEKRDLMPEMLSDIDLAHHQRIKCAFDAGGLLNPGKVFPTLHRCAELGRLHVHGGKLPFPDIPRF